jgi:hypothetical protein
MTIDELKAEAAEVARALQATGDGALSNDLRRRFIAVRAELFQRGIYDPLLVRFDSATVAKASVREIGEQLAAVAETLR